MKAMILAAGVGSRLDPLTRTVPKPMVPIVNRPVIEHIIAKLKKHGVTEIMVNLHYLGDVIKAHLGDGSNFGVARSLMRRKTAFGAMPAASSGPKSSSATTRFWLSVAMTFPTSISRPGEVPPRQTGRLDDCPVRCG